mgnify:CR=1 FL=1
MWKFIAGMIFALWGALVVTQNAFIINADESENAMGIPMLNCTYFTGLGTIRIDYVKTDVKMIGKESCPNMISTAE